MNVHSLLPCKKCGKFPILTVGLDNDNIPIYYISCKNCRYPSFEDSILYTVIGNWNNEQEKENNKEK